MKLSPNRLSKTLTSLYLILFCAIAVYLFFFPAAKIIYQLQDESLSNGEIPKFAYTWHQNISEKFSNWATKRVLTEKAYELDINDISGTEWPIFSSVFYLWATEALQEDWETKQSIYQHSPLSYSRDAVEAAIKLITDPNHANWVKQHWGDSYLQSENLFYRMLIIAGMTSYQNLTGDTQYQTFLKQQVISLSSELDTSKYGLLDDYPHQCYPIDILPAIAVLKRASQLLNIESQAFVDRSIRAFSGTRLDPKTNLPAYIANADKGYGIGPARGVGISYMLIWASELWPSVNDGWYDKFEKHFYQSNRFITGIREFSKHYSQAPSWTFDVDAGPVLFGIGAAASAFGLGAARQNGRMDHAYPLSAEAIAATWPLPNGTLLAPRLLSNLSDAPFVGETALLFIFTKTPYKSIAKTSTPHIPLVVYIAVCFYLALGILLLLNCRQKVKKWHIPIHSNVYFFAKKQIILCIAILSICLILLMHDYIFFAIIALLVVQIFPFKVFHAKQV